MTYSWTTLAFSIRKILQCFCQYVRLDFGEYAVGRTATIKRHLWWFSDIYLFKKIIPCLSSAGADFNKENEWKRHLITALPIPILSMPIVLLGPPKWPSLFWGGKAFCSLHQDCIQRSSGAHKWIQTDLLGLLASLLKTCTSLSTEIMTRNKCPSDMPLTSKKSNGITESWVY